MDSTYYTSVVKWGNNLLYRGFDRGEGVARMVKYEPYLFVPHPDGEFRTLEGDPVRRKDFACIRDAEGYVQRTREVQGLKYWGLEKFNYVFINDSFPGELEPDLGLLWVCNIDIEVAADDGFPDVSLADKPVTAITMKIRDKVIAFGCGEFKPPEGVTYVKCDDERDLLTRFLDVWTNRHPDIITGWNVDGFDIPYLINRITALFDENTAKLLSPWNVLITKKLFYHGQEREVLAPLGITSLDYLVLYRNKKLVLEPREEYKLDYIAHVELGEKKLDYSEYGSLLELYRQDFQKFMEYNVKDVLLVDKLELKLRLIELVVSIAYTNKVNYEDVLGSVMQWEVVCHNFLMAEGVVVPGKQDAVKESLVGAYVKDPVPGLYHWVVSEDLDSLYSHLIMQFNISPETYCGKLDGTGEVQRHWYDETAHAPEPRDEFQVKKRIDDVLAGELDKWRADITTMDVTVAANFSTYRKDFQGFFPRILEKMYAKRVELKAKAISAKREVEAAVGKAEKEVLERLVAKFENAQKAYKTNLNSAYGCLTNEFFRFYSHANAEAITTSGQLAIRWIEKEVNIYINKLLKTEGVDYIIASDTDSIYINFGPLVDKLLPGAEKNKVIDFLDQVCKTKLKDFITDAFQRLADYTNSMAQKMSMKRESIADKGVWTAKKKYIMNVYDKEGVRYSEPKVEVKGIESVRSSTPIGCKQKIKDALKLMMQGTEEQVIELIETFRTEFYKMPVNEIAKPSGIDGVRKYSDRDGNPIKGCTMHVRGALVFNRHIKERGLKHHAPIYDGDKIKYIPLKTPNPVGSHVIGWSDYLPPELGLESYIDYEEHYDKVFVRPLDRILKVMGWSAEKIETLDAFIVK